MSEIRTPYVVSGRATGPDNATLHPFDSPLFVQPSWLDVRAVIDLIDFTGSQVANLVGVQSRTVRKWTSPPETANHAPIPYAAWRLMLIAARLVEPTIIL
jgi:hypothetical protein